MGVIEGMFLIVRFYAIVNHHCPSTVVSSTIATLLPALHCLDIIMFFIHYHCCSSRSILHVESILLHRHL